jgi:hypothetical protein
MEIDLRDPRLSPGQRLALTNIIATLSLPPRKAADAAVEQAVDEALGGNPPAQRARGG